MRVDRRYRGKPLPVSDLEAIAKFRAELTVYGKLRDRGDSHEVAQAKVFGDDKDGAP